MSDGLIAPVNAPSGIQVYPGVQPGVTGGIVLATYVIVFGTNGGIFIYTPVPGPGNLVGSWTASAGTDPYGNTVPEPGLIVYGANGSYINLNSTGGVGGNPAVLFQPQNATHVTQQPQVWAISQNPGAVNEFEALVVSSGTAGGNDGAGFQFLSQAADGSGAAVISAVIGAVVPYFTTKVLHTVSVPITATAGTISAPTLITTDTPHQATLINGWTNSGANANGLWYRLLPDGRVELTLDIVPPLGVVGNSVCFQLPAGYRPITPKNLGPIGDNNPQVNNSPSLPWLFVAANGNVQVTAMEVANIAVFGTFTLPLW